MKAFDALDKLDRAILRRLQDNGRETYDVIGEQVGLSPSAVLRRVKRLEDSGVIHRYVALVQPEAVGLGLTAYLNVRLEKHTESHKRNPMDLFRASVQTWPEVVECASLTGEMDYLLRVVVADPGLPPAPRTESLPANGIALAESLGLAPALSRAGLGRAAWMRC